ncbi:MAG: cytidylate kinase-like family protein [Desulfobacteraceae bacterium]|nr:MAG: cytidylate kinase-like family protein [Desulfobacteraceae bacterium]
MSIVTITTGFYGKGQEVAEKVASRLDYRCISRETLLHASDGLNLPVLRAFLSFRKGPSDIELTSAEKEKYIAGVQLLLLSDYQKDNVVHHGMAGHFIVRGVEHGLKVLIMQDIEDRMRSCMEQEGLSRKDALIYLKERDHPLIEWGFHLYGIHPWDSDLYDLAIHLKRISVDAAVDMICRTVALDVFQTTPGSQRHVDDLLLAARAKWEIRDINPYADVSAHDGSLTVRAVLDGASGTSVEERDRLTEEIQAAVTKIPGVTEVRIDAALYPIRDMVEEGTP